MSIAGVIAWTAIFSFSLATGYALTMVSDRLVTRDFHNARFRWLYLDIEELSGWIGDCIRYSLKRFRR